MAAQRWQFWLGFGFFVSVLVALSSGMWWLYGAAMDANQVPLRRLVVQGDLQYVSRAEVRTALVQQPLGSFFSADVNDIRLRVEQLPWVARVSVRKEWPDVLQVFVVEQQPLAHWNVNSRPEALVNQQAQVFEADKSRLQDALPYLQGPEQAVEQTVAHYRNVAALLELNGYQVQELRFSERFSVEVVLSSGVELRLGREALLERVQRFIDLYPRLQQQRKEAIDYIDLRYDTGLAVAWRQASKLN